MRIEYTLDKSDFLVHQLYGASKSHRIIKSRKNSRIRVPIVYFILGLILFVLADSIIAFLFLAVGIAWYLLQPLYMRKRFLSHYEKYIDENYQNRYGKSVVIEFNSEYIIATDYTGESKIKIEVISEINEIQDYIFLKLATGESLILPKKRIENMDELKGILSKIASDLSIKHNIELNWKWE
ncbi:MAG TPA: YcxB family protein [Tenuifilaceae bacterium]|nr:YcxB family protein [Tenuifilaceae bacterium]